MRILQRNHGPQAKQREVAQVVPGPCSPSVTTTGNSGVVSLDFETSGKFGGLSIEMTWAEAGLLRDLLTDRLRSA